MTGLSPKAANDLVRAFVDQKILVETTGYQRNRIFVFDEYVGMFWWARGRIMKNYYAEFEGQLKEEAILNALVAENLGKVKQNL